MTKSTFMGKYPIQTLQIAKNSTTLTNIDEILSFYKTQIDAHKLASYIAIFDHYSHTQVLEGEINPEIKDAKNIIFCFGAAIPNTKILAARPRSIGVAELEDSFVVEFMEAPKEPLTEVMSKWTQEMITK